MSVHLKGEWDESIQPNWKISSKTLLLVAQLQHWEEERKKKRNFQCLLFKCEKQLFFADVIVCYGSRKMLFTIMLYTKSICDAMLRHSPIFRSLLPLDFHYLPSFLLHSSIHQLWNINNLQLLPSLFYLFRCSFSNVPQHDCVELNVKRAALP